MGILNPAALLKKRGLNPLWQPQVVVPVNNPDRQFVYCSHLLLALLVGRSGCVTEVWLVVPQWIFSLEIQGKEKSETPFSELCLGSPCLWNCCIRDRDDRSEPACLT